MTEIKIGTVDEIQIPGIEGNVSGDVYTLETLQRLKIVSANATYILTQNWDGDNCVDNNAKVMIALKSGAYGAIKVLEHKEAA